ncbi:MAG: hypothetical protein IJD58_09045 [Lachnospiraceae bacterium]|nr:hypothetical protein [Lachnospiraceae bacterium]
MKKCDTEETKSYSSSKNGLNCMKKCDTEETKSYSRTKNRFNCMKIWNNKINTSTKNEMCYNHISKKRNKR